MITIENENTFKHALHTGLILFVGAGFSVHARNSGGEPLMTGAALNKDLSQQFEAPEGLSLAQTCSFIQSTNREAFDQYIVQKFTVDHYDPSYHSLFNAAIKSVYTTNVDDLIPRIYAKSDDHYLQDVDLQGVPSLPSSVIQYTALHGSVSSDSRTMRFGLFDLARVQNADPRRWYALKTELSKMPVLLWGYQLADSAVVSMFDNEGTDTQDRWIVIRSGDNNQSQAQFFSQLGFRIIRADTLELLHYIRDLPGSTPVAIGNRQASESRLLAPFRIPSPNQIPQRPIADFFEGAQPSWSDAYSPNVRKLAPYYKAIDAIHGGRNIIITGAAATGKSTLLLQLATQFSSEVPKYYMEGGLTAELASLIAKDVGSEKRLILVDRFTDDVDSLERLLENPGIQVVAADRDDRLQSSRHRIDVNRFMVINSGELTSADIQALTESIPEELRRHDYRSEINKEGTDPSVFEIIQNRVLARPLRGRIVSLLRELKARDPQQAELLLLIGYLENCRSKCSMDLIFSYFSSDIPDFRRIYQLVNSLGSQVRILSRDQDFFGTRSQIAGETIIDAATSPDLRNLLTKFHTRVSPRFIPSQGVFRRFAYHYKLIEKAFPMLAEGVQFYRDAYSVADSDTNSYYILQQAAIYCKDNGSWEEALDFIRQARHQSNRSDWTIRNTYASIYFHYNYRPQFRYTAEARSAFESSLETLRTCYSYDGRKEAHAREYLDQVIKLREVFDVEELMPHLILAEQWHLEEVARSPWRRYPQIGLRLARRHLREVRG